MSKTKTTPAKAGKSNKPNKAPKPHNLAGASRGKTVDNLQVLIKAYSSGTGLRAIGDMAKPSKVDWRTARRLLVQAGVSIRAQGVKV